MESNIKRPLKICFFLSSLGEKGGTERVASIIANQLNARGYNVQCLSLWDGLKPGFAIATNIQLFELYNSRQKFIWKYIAVIQKLRKFIKQQQCDVFISVDSYLTLYSTAACFCLRQKVKHIGWEHFNYNADLGLLSRRISRRVAARTTDTMVLLTKGDKALWEKYAKCKADLVVIPNPLTFDSIKPEDRNWSRKLVISVGRFNKQKGFDLLIKSWKKVHHVIPDWKLYIIGDGEQKIALQKQINQEGLNDSIEIKPFSNTIHEYYMEASLYCLSSRFEGLPMVLLESLAFGLPIVSFDCETGPSDIVQHETNGLLVPNGDTDELANGIIKLAQDEDLRKRMGINALRKSNEFKMDNIIDIWELTLNS